MFEFFSQHPILLATVSGAATWLFNNVVTVMVTELPAPTKDSTQKYAYWFRVLNRVVGNYARARSTAVEKSPNWSDAVDQHIQTLQSNGTFGGSVNTTAAGNNTKSNG